MNRISSITLGILLLSLVARDATAQWNVARFGTERSSVYTTFGLDPAIVTSLGYARVTSLFGRDVQLSGEVGVAAARMDANDFRVRLGTQASLLRRGSLQLTGSATFSTRGTQNTIYRGINFGADFASTLGVYRQGWFAAGEFGFDKAVITHVTLSDYYREHYYPDAKDGWYLNAGGTYRYGVTGGLTMGRAQLAGRAGWLRSEYNKSDLMPPFYASVGLGFGF